MASEHDFELAHALLVWGFFLAAKRAQASYASTRVALQPVAPSRRRRAFSEPVKNWLLTSINPLLVCKRRLRPPILYVGIHMYGLCWVLREFAACGTAQRNRVRRMDGA